MPAQIPYQILTFCKRRYRTTIQNICRGRIEDFDQLGSVTPIPVLTIERHLMGLPIGEVEIDTEAGPRIPVSRNPVHGCGGLLQRAHVNRGRSPCSGALIETYGGISRVIYGVIRNGEPVNSVDALPGPLCG